MIRLTRSHPARNMHRFYALQVTPTLFGEGVLIAEWGRMGCPGTVKQAVFPSLALAERAMAKRRNAKIRKGYQQHPGS